MRTSEQKRAYHKMWRERNKEHCATYRKHIRGHRGAAHRKDRYGLTNADYHSMVTAQNGRCALCGQLPEDRYGALCVDHDHATGEVRDLLCRRCNRGLGFFLDDPGLLSKAMTYLLRHSRRTRVAA